MTAIEKKITFPEYLYYLLVKKLGLTGYVEVPLNLDEMYHRTKDDFDNGLVEAELQWYDGAKDFVQTMEDAAGTTAKAKWHTYNTKLRAVQRYTEEVTNRVFYIICVLRSKYQDVIRYWLGVRSCHFKGHPDEERFIQKYALASVFRFFFDVSPENCIVRKDGRILLVDVEIRNRFTELRTKSELAAEHFSCMIERLRYTHTERSDVTVEHELGITEQKSVIGYVSPFDITHKEVKPVIFETMMWCCEQVLFELWLWSQDPRRARCDMPSLLPTPEETPESEEVREAKIALLKEHGHCQMLMHSARRMGPLKPDQDTLKAWKAEMKKYTADAQSCRARKPDTRPAASRRAQVDVLSKAMKRKLVDNNEAFASTRRKSACCQLRF